MVVTDGDRFSPDQRRNQLEKEAEAQNLARLGADEKVTVFVPCRNIESWIQWLETGEIDETTDYKNRFANARSTKYAQQQMPEPCNRPISAVPAGCLRTMEKDLGQLAGVFQQ
ncbi:MAG: hypothetical protein K9K82_14395 [Desulfobacteraceae bacterium]|nr:hypothetical protein [Desulfobacteraceae bacterium]